MADTTYVSQVTPLTAASAQDFNNHVYRQQGPGGTGYPHAATNVSVTAGTGFSGPTVQDALGQLGVLIDNAPGTVASMSALRALTSTSIPLLYLTGYNAEGDGGEGFFWYNSSDITSTDNGGTIIVDASGHRWYRFWTDQWYSVRFFGAYGDGSHDDTTALSNAMAAHTNVYFPKGTYKVSTTITFSANQMLIGQSAADTIISTSATTGDVFLVPANCNYTIRDLNFQSSVTRISGAYINSSSIASSGYTTGCIFSGYINALIITDLVGCIRDCQFTSNSTGVPISFYDNHTTSLFVVDNCFITTASTGGTGIYLHGATGVQISNSVIYAHTYGIRISPSASSGSSGRVINTILNNLVVNNSGTSGLYIVPTGSSTVVGIKCINCLFGAAGADGVHIDGTSGTLQDVQFINLNTLGNTGHGIYCLNVTDMHITAAAIAANTATGKYGVYIDNPCTNMSIRDCRIGNTDNAAGNYGGIYIATGTSNNIVIENNNLLGNSNYSINSALASTSTTQLYWKGNIGAGLGPIPISGSQFTSGTPWTNYNAYDVLLIVNGFTLTTPFATMGGTQIISSNTLFSVVVPQFQSITLTFTGSAPSTVEIIPFS